MRSRLFQYNPSLKIWFQWDQETPGKKRSTDHIFQKTTIMSEHMKEAYEVASVQQNDLAAKLLSTGQFEDNTDTENSVNEWVIQYLALPEDGGARFAT